MFRMSLYFFFFLKKNLLGVWNGSHLHQCNARQNKCSFSQGALLYHGAVFSMVLYLTEDIPYCNVWEVFSLGERWIPPFCYWPFQSSSNYTAFSWSSHSCGKPFIYNVLPFLYCRNLVRTFMLVSTRYWSVDFISPFYCYAIISLSG